MNAAEFKQRMSELPEPITDKRPPFWEFWRWDLWRRAQIDDPHNFTFWPCVYHTMLVNHWPGPIKYEFNQLTEDYHDAIIMPNIGPRDPFGDVIVSYPFSMNLIHQAHHLYQWQQATGRRIDQLSTIVEFGGGYGAMALLCHRLGFKGRYVIYDLPEFSLLQQWYLSQHGVEAEWNPRHKPKGADLFMALYSLSEVEPEKRDKLIVKANGYLFLYSGRWEGWNNVEWFQERFPLLGYCGNWQHTELTHLPDRNNWYSIGW